MKAEDLMIGDWVIRRGVPEEPMRLYDMKASAGIAYLDQDGRGVTEKFENIEPIPLTPEILEKNGFIKDTGGEELYLIDFASLIDVGYGFEMFISNDEKGEFNGIKKYVHELQHTLKLCGIEKNIIL